MSSNSVKMCKELKDENSPRDSIAWPSNSDSLTLNAIPFCSAPPQCFNDLCSALDE